MLEKRPVRIPEDPVMFTETALGFVTTAGSMISADEYQDKRDRREFMNVIERAQDAVYEDRFTREHYELVVEFIRSRDYDVLKKLGQELSS